MENIKGRVGNKGERKKVAHPYCRPIWHFFRKKISLTLIADQNSGAQKFRSPLLPTNMPLFLEIIFGHFFRPNFWLYLQIVLQSAPAFIRTTSFISKLYLTHYPAMQCGKGELSGPILLPASPAPRSSAPRPRKFSIFLIFYQKRPFTRVLPRKRPFTTGFIQKTSKSELN